MKMSVYPGAAVTQLAVADLQENVPIYFFFSGLLFAVIYVSVYTFLYIPLHFFFLSH